MTVLIDGGSGSLGNALVDYFLTQEYEKIIVYSRDEYKHSLMKQRLGYDGYHGERVRWIVGDVRDRWRLETAMKGVDHVVHCAALKQIPVGEYNPEEFIKTNILGAQNVIDVCVSRGVKKCIALSTDKAVNPINLYGKTKAVADSLFSNANCYGDTIFSIVRYGNVSGSRGSVIPHWREEIKKGNELVVTDERMTRFWITLERAVDEIAYALSMSEGGETFIPDMPSYYIKDLALAMAEKYSVGEIRPGEKIDEDMILDTDEVYDIGARYIVYPSVQWKKLRNRSEFRVKISYNSGCINNLWLSVSDLKERLNGI
ncbi:hypothetical protein LCGC14_2072130 [marine sediment metagenome]|uniref:Polysaccharide biosynthesis protein CapD-like domain-containing protein n=1 Tax=marine sediment metagenome TaxID=412755 RepID=A0A0F9F5E8_9ZZZZ